MRGQKPKQTRLKAAFVFSATLFCFPTLATNEQPETESTETPISKPDPASSLESKEAEIPTIDQSEDSGQVQRKTSKVVAIDINELIERLKATEALGLFTKLALKGDIEDIIEDVDKYKRKNKAVEKLVKVRSEFEGLVLKTITLLDDKDPGLARDIYLAREYVWISIVETKT